MGWFIIALPTFMGIYLGYHRDMMGIPWTCLERGI
jgi:hypothetical protein